MSVLVSVLVSPKTKKINVVGQVCLNMQTHGQYHALKTQRIGSEKTYGPKRMFRLALSGHIYFSAFETPTFFILNDFKAFQLSIVELC